MVIVVKGFGLLHLVDSFTLAICMVLRMLVEDLEDFGLIEVEVFVLDGSIVHKVISIGPKEEIKD